MLVPSSDDVKMETCTSSADSLVVTYASRMASPAEKVRKLREESGLSQEVFARRHLGISSKQLSRIENGAQIGRKAAEALARYSGIPAAYFMGIEQAALEPIHDHEPSMKERAIFALGKLTDDERRFVEEQYELVARSLGDSMIGPIVSFLEGKLRERRDQERDRPDLPSRERVEEPSRLPPGSLRRADRKRRK